MALDLYARIEEMFLDKEAADILWSKFIEILNKLEVKKILDIGCGGGGFCLLAKHNGFDIKGIDLSRAQVEKAVKKGCKCEAKDVCEVKERFEAAVAVFDVINYMNEDELKKFFSCVKERTDYFVFDINTLYAMEDLAIGTLKAEDENRFSVLYSEFEDNKLITEITLFEKKGDCYIKHQDKIIQYYYSVDQIEKLSGMKLVDIVPISLYGSEEAEKLILTFKS
jgi:SAM-dependent methyltransferase